MANSFIMGVIEVHRVTENGDYLVQGKLKGTAKVGELIAIANPGEDEKKVAGSLIKGIRLVPDDIDTNETSDCFVTLWITDPGEISLKTGSVIFTEKAAGKAVRTEYINALADYFIGLKKMNISDEEYEALTISDLAELLKVHTHFYAQNASQVKGKNKEKVEQITAQVTSVLVKKILAADSIYCVFSALTKEPFMFSSSSHDENGNFFVTPPTIKIFPKACLSMIEATYANEAFEIYEIENGDDGKGIYNFFAESFYINGAMGATVIGNNTVIPAGLLASADSYLSSLSSDAIKTLNPNLVRWLLALNQLPEPKNEGEENLVKVLGKFRDTEISKRKLLVPVQKANETGAYRLALRNGKYDRQTIAVFTDLKRLREEFDLEWEVSLMELDELIVNYDVEINPSKEKREGCYINETAFEHILALRDKVSE